MLSCIYIQFLISSGLAGGVVCGDGAEPGQVHRVHRLLAEVVHAAAELVAPQNLLGLQANDDHDFHFTTLLYQVGGAGLRGAAAGLHHALQRNDVL